jgi:CelD/BcsL family acetyltransferase involved in cellulose biosynthesis
MPLDLPTNPSMSAKNVRVECIGTLGRLLTLRPAWEALEYETACRASAGFAWALTGWQCVAEPAGGELCLIAVWHGPHLEAVWGLVRYRRHGIRVLEPLGAEASEYTEILAHPGLETSGMLIDLLVRAVRTQGDCIRLQHVDPSGLAAKFCARFPMASTRDPIRSCSVHLRGFVSFEAYRATRNKETLRKMGQLTRALARQGDVEIGMVDDPSQRLELVDWLLTEKANWMARYQMKNPWITRPSYRSFLIALANPLAGRSPLMLVRLRVNGQTIAGGLFSIDPHFLEYLIAAHDPAWEDFSPGRRLIDHCVAWAHQHGRDFDLRIGNEAYKRSWAAQEIIRHSYHIALTPLGLIAVLQEAMRLTWLRSRGRYRRSMGGVVGRLVKPLLRRLPSAILPKTVQQAITR